MGRSTASVDNKFKDQIREGWSCSLLVCVSYWGGTRGAILRCSVPAWLSMRALPLHWGQTLCRASPVTHQQVTHRAAHRPCFSIPHPAIFNQKLFIKKCFILWTFISFLIRTVNRTQLQSDSTPLLVKATETILPFLFCPCLILLNCF